MIRILAISNVEGENLCVFEHGTVRTGNNLIDYAMHNNIKLNGALKIDRSNIHGPRYTNALEILINPKVKEEHSDIFPDMFTDAFNTLWNFAKEIHKNDE